IGDQRAHDARRVLGTQGDVLPTAIGEGVHLLGHDIGRVADRALEDLGELEDRRRDLLEPETLGRQARGLADATVPPHLFGQKVMGAADRLKLLGHLKLGWWVAIRRRRTAWSWPSRP